MNLLRAVRASVMSRRAAHQRAAGVGLAVALVVLVGVAGASASPIYTTNFLGTENPLSEGGAWAHGPATGWANVQKSGGEAFGTQTGTGTGNAGFNDSYTLLTNFSPNVTETATIKIDPNVASGGEGVGFTHEVELLFRMKATATTTRGYEMNFDSNGNVTLVRWNGAMGDYTVLATGNRPFGRLIQTGDVFSATANNRTLTASINGIQVLSFTDTVSSVFADGAAGIGFFIRDTTPATQAFNAEYGFTSFTGVDLTPLTTTPEPPTLGLVGTLIVAACYGAKRTRRRAKQERAKGSAPAGLVPPYW